MYKRMAFALISASIVLTMSGCGTYTKPAKQNELKVRSTENRSILDGNINGNMNGNTNGYNNGTKNVHVNAAEKIQTSILKIKGVSAATVFVNNNDVIVGVDLKDNANKADVEKQVKKAVEKTDKGYKVHVTSDKNMHTRIHDMKSHMTPMDGHPVRDMAKDVGILIEDMGKAFTAPLR